MYVKFITLKINILNKNKEEEILSRFSGNSDLFNLLDEYCSHIFRHRKTYIDNQNNNRTFSLDRPHVLLEDDRELYGYFDSGLTGEEVNIKDLDSNDLKLKVQTKDLMTRDLFFLLRIPKNSKFGYIVIQKKSTHGVKKFFEESFNDFLKSKGYLENRISLKPAPNFDLLEKMLEFGRLKEVQLIKKGIFTSFEEHFDKTGIMCQGESQEVIKFNSNSIVSAYKNALYKAYRQNYKEHQTILLDGVSDEFNEVSFTLELDKLIKTFYVKEKDKIRSDIDITHNIDFEHNGIPKTQSLLENCKKLINIISR